MIHCDCNGGQEGDTMGVDADVLNKIATGNFSLSSMIRLLRHLWVLDVGSVFEEIFDEGDEGKLQLYLNTGVWEDNKKVLDAMTQNGVWWDKYHSCQCKDGTHIFVGE